MKKNLASIIVPVFNAEKFLDKCIESIINQEYLNIEILLINDGSSDNSLEICEKYQILDKRIIVFNKNNEGVALTRNFGIDHADGQYITFVDSDDFLDPRFIKMMIESTDNDETLPICNIAVSKNNTIVKERLINDLCKQKLSKKEYLSELFLKFKTNPFIGSQCNKLYFKDILINNGIRFIPGRTFAEDFIFNIDYLDHIKYIKIIDFSLYNYRMDNLNSLSKNKYSIEYLWNQYKELYERIYLLFLRNEILNDYKLQIDSFLSTGIRHCLRILADNNLKMMIRNYNNVYKIFNDIIVIENFNNVIKNDKSLIKYFGILKKRKYAIIIYIYINKFKNILRSIISKHGVRIKK